MTRPLDGRVAVVTGSGRNIGREIALALAEDGARVVVNARSSREEVEDVAAAIRKDGGEALAVLADVSDPEQVDRLIAETIKA